jgi:hypothetical protein
VLTKFYGWGPHDAWSLSMRDLMWWNDQAKSMNDPKQ